MTSQTATITNHRWAKPLRPTHLLTLRTCIKCGITKQTHHEGNEHWSDFVGQDGRKIETVGGGTPPCWAGRMKVAA
jgi:hypothetical protein